MNPGEHITATDVHGISDADVADAKPFSFYGPNLATGLVNCDFAGYNVKFDLRVLQAEFKRAGIAWSYEGAYLLDSLRLWQVTKPRTLSDAVREWLGREPTQAHRALGDAEDALEVAYKIAGDRTLKELHELSFPVDPNWVDADGKIVWVGGQAALSFGKHAQKPLRNVPPDYLQWMINNEFPESTKVVLRAALEGRYPSR
jgi:DNA polymerase-3 subunit epsilon